MITPRHTRLVRVADLHAFHRAIARYSCAGDAVAVRTAAVLVPTEAAVHQLRSTLETMELLAAPGRPVAAWPEILTRSAWYDCLHHAAPDAPRQLGPIEREVLLGRAAREAIDAGERPPFHVRPPLVAEMLRFLDTMLRLGRTLDAFERLMVEELEARVPIDRGAERLLRQTRFLVASFRRYGELVAESGGHDEHLLRAHLLAGDSVPPFTRVVVTMGDRSCGSDGLWPADFDLLARLPRLEAVDIIATDALLAAGFHERLHDLLPGLEETQFGTTAALAGREPVVAVPSEADTRWWISRDREEEIASIARRIKARHLEGAARGPTSEAPPVALDRVAIVCRRPLPYVYLAQSCLSAAGIPVQAFDDLPLAAEPFAAALDLVFRFVQSGFARRHAVALLRSPHFVFSDGTGVVPREAIAAFETVLREAGRDADAATLDRLIPTLTAVEATSSQRLASRAAVAASAAARDLGPLRTRQPASTLFASLLAFLEAHLSGNDGSPLGERTGTACDAVLGALRGLAAAHRQYDDRATSFDQSVSTIRRWMESQTFSPRTGTGGLHLVDADAARYGDFDEVHLVGVVEHEWPDKEGRTTFYPLSLLNQLGWPPERLRLAAARAAFRDLVRLAGVRVSVSTFVLEDDALVEPSPLLDEVERIGLPVTVEPAVTFLRTVPEEALSLDPVRADALAPVARDWVALRQSRSAGDDPRYHGRVDPTVVKALAVRRIETYVDCPFRYFAEVLLGLHDETDEDPTEGPRAQGKYLHDVLAQFFDSWQAAGHGAITPDNLEAARVAFRGVVEARLAPLDPADAALWRARLLGSVGRGGIGEAVLRAEAASGDEVVRRLLEHRLEGPCRLEARPRETEHGAEAAPAGDQTDVEQTPATATRRERVINLRGVADRIDILPGKRFRIVDYKLGRAPDVRRAVQLPLYAVQARAQFASSGHGELAAAGAAYLAFGERDPHVPLTGRNAALDRAIADGQDRALQAVDGIERGWFPARPAQPFMCGRCPYAGLCRKDYADGPQ